MLYDTWLFVVSGLLYLHPLEFIPLTYFLYRSLKERYIPHIVFVIAYTIIIFLRGVLVASILATSYGVASILLRNRGLIRRKVVVSTILVAILILILKIFVPKPDLIDIATDPLKWFSKDNTWLTTLIILASLATPTIMHRDKIYPIKIAENMILKIFVSRSIIYLLAFLSLNLLGIYLRYSIEIDYPMLRDLFFSSLIVLVSYLMINFLDTLNRRREKRQTDDLGGLVKSLISSIVFLPWFFATSIIIAFYGVDNFLVIDRVSVKPYFSSATKEVMDASYLIYAFTPLIFLFTGSVRGVVLFSRASILYGLISSVAIVMGLRDFGVKTVSMYFLGTLFSAYLLLVIASLSFLVILFSLFLSIRRIIRRESLENIGSISIKKDLQELLILFLIGFIVLYIPYYPNINPYRRLVDIDYIYYDKWLSRVNDNDFIHDAFVRGSHGLGDRPLFLILIYLINKIIPYKTFDTVYIALAGSILLVLAEIITRSAGLAKYTGYLSALLAAVPLVYVYGGFQANLFSEIFVYATLAIYFMNRYRYLTPIFSLASLLSHNEVWLLSSIIFLPRPLIFALWLAPGLILLLAKFYLFKLPTVLNIRYQFYIPDIRDVMNLVDFEVNIHVWGSMSTWIIYLLTIITIIILLIKRDIFLVRVSMIPLMVLLFILYGLKMIVPIEMLRGLGVVVHAGRVLMNTPLWILPAYILDKAIRSQNKWVIELILGVEIPWIIWILANAVPK